MENNSYFVFGSVFKIERESNTSYITFKNIKSSDEELNGLKEFGIGFINKNINFEINQKVLLVFDSDTDCLINHFLIK